MIVRSDLYAVFLSVTVVSVATPGPAVLLAINNGARYGPRRTLLSTFGNATGLVLIASVAIAGLGAAVQTSPVLFLLMKTVGVGYLLSLAVRQFRSPSNLFSEAIRPDTAPGASRGLYLEGFTVATTNPKAIVFCAALFPQFLAADRPLLPQFLVLLATFLTLSITSLSSWSFAGTHARDWFSRGDRARWFNRLMGVAFLLLACGVFALQRSAA